MQLVFINSGIASFVLTNLLATKGNKCYRQLSWVRMHSIRQGVSPSAEKQKQQHCVLSHMYQLPPLSSHLLCISSCLSPLSALGWAHEISAAHSGPSLRTASTSQCLLWLLTFAFGEKDTNLPFYGRHSILQWYIILFYHLTFDLILQCWKNLTLSSFCEFSLRHLLPNPVYWLFPVALQEAQIKKEITVKKHVESWEPPEQKLSTTQKGRLCYL